MSGKVVKDSQSSISLSWYEYGPVANYLMGGNR